MPDDTTQRGPRDSSRINVHERWELDYWSQKFGVTHEELKAAVAAVGPMVNDVRQYLGKAVATRS